MLPLSPLPMPSNKRARSEGPGQLSLPLPLPKRRAIVPACSPHTRSSHALTSTNLDRLQRALSQSQPQLATPPTAGDMTESRVSSQGRPCNTLRDRQQLTAYGVSLDMSQPLPADLKALVQTILQPRDPAENLSPNTKTIIDRRRFATDQSERDCVTLMAPLLLYTGEADMHLPGTTTEPLIVSKNEVTLHRHFLPPSPSIKVSRTWGPLKEARVDSCFGYLSRQDAATSRCAAPFTDAEEEALNQLCLTQRMYFPFFTSQWKTASSQVGISAAQVQAARDGASVVNYLHTFFEAANGIAPSPAVACHFSLVCDLNVGEIWVHWREGNKHYMEYVNSFILRDQSSLHAARQILKNILKHAVNTRLQNIKEAIPRFTRNWSCGSKIPTLMTPETSASGQAKKRARSESSNQT